MISNKRFVLVEYIFFSCVSLVTIGLIILSLYSYIFIPASLIMLSLIFFGIAYVLDVQKKKKLIVYFSFVVGVLLLFIAIFYTLVRTING